MKNLSLYAFFFVVGLSVTYVFFGQALSTETTNMPMNTMTASSTMHMHSMVEVDASLPEPTVAIELLKDTMGGYNLHILTENFTFTPENISQAPVANEGHAHLYINGIKIARVYGEWFNIPASDLQPGANAIEVTLNANDHAEWVLEGTHISATTTVSL